MSRRSHLAVLVVVAALAGVAVGGAAATSASAGSMDEATDVEHAVDGPWTTGGIAQTTGSPGATIDVSLDGTAVEDGGSITTGNDPTLSVRAESEGTIRIVSVRIDGRTVRSYAPNDTALETSTDLDLESGAHDLRVVVETDGSTTIYDATVTEDSTRPLMTFDSPFSTGFTGENNTYEGPKDEYTLNKSNILLEGSFHDESHVEKAIIETTYHYNYADNTRGERERIVLRDPGESISQRLRLGPNQPELGAGLNTLEITLFDAFDHVKKYRIEIRVEDTDPPEIEVLDREAVETRSAVRLHVRASDRVGVESVGTRLGPKDGSGLQYQLSPQPPGARPIEHTFTRTVEVPSGSETITVVAEDGTNPPAKREVTVNYTELVTPRVQFDREATEAVDGRRIRVRGRVYDGQISRVRVETVSPGGDVLDLNTAYTGGITDSVTIDETLRMDVYPATIRVRTIDVDGTEHVETIRVSQSADAVGDGDAEPIVVDPSNGSAGDGTGGESGDGASDGGEGGGTGGESEADGDGTADEDGGWLPGFVADRLPLGMIPTGWFPLATIPTGPLPIGPIPVEIGLGVGLAGGYLGVRWLTW
ncbi:hypothetical protein ACFQAS_11835 [Halopenitus salinus]|uniref:Uncharacterized protein n=1 Tax=Halopenitus salinus TaxID=1198295 RepID=A0ABD5UX71_9EURY